MIQVKEFVDTDIVPAERSANAFLATLSEEQVINVRYGTFVKKTVASAEVQRSSILVVYRKEVKEDKGGRAHGEARS